MRAVAPYLLLETALGPATADEFSAAGQDGTPPLPVRKEMSTKAAFIRDLLRQLDSLPLMEDWRP
jgi:hypothetical protein